MRRVIDRLSEGAVRIANKPGELTLVATVLLVCSSVGYAITEEEGPIRSMWWAIVTASTVGYGDAYPETTAGRGVAAILIVAMVTLIIPMITASFTSKLIVDRDAFTHEEQEEIKATLHALCRRFDVEPQIKLASDVGVDQGEDAADFGES